MTSHCESGAADLWVAAVDLAWIQHVDPCISVCPVRAVALGYWERGWGGAVVNRKVEVAKGQSGRTVCCALQADAYGGICY